MTGPQDVACQTDASLFDLPPRKERVVTQYFELPVEAVEKRATECGLSVITPAAAFAEIMDRIQDSLRQRTSMDSYQTRSWYLKFLQEPMLAKMFRKFTKQTPPSKTGNTKRTWTCTAP
eukprot:5591535-Pleurochrysis_carterae.AAC.1